MSRAIEFAGVRTADDVRADLVDWKALLPSRHVTTFLQSAPLHTLPRVCHLLRLPLDCVVCVLEFVPISDLVNVVARATRQLSRVVRALPLWRRFDLASLVSRSGVATRRPPVERIAFWMNQLVRGRFTQLERLSIATGSIHHRELRNALAASPALTSLDVSHCEGFDDACCVALAQAACCTPCEVGGGQRNAPLRDFRANFCTQFAGYTLCETLSQCSGLQTLELSGCGQLVPAEIRRIFMTLKALRVLKLRSTRAGLESFRCATETERAAMQLPELQLLDVSGCVDFGDEAMVASINLVPALKSFSADGCNKLTDAGVLSLASPDRGLSLHTISLSHCGHLSDSSLGRLGVAMGSSLVKVAVDRSRVTGAALCRLLQLPRLESLSCNACVYALKDVSLSGDLRRVVTKMRHVLSEASKDFLGIRRVLPTTGGAKSVKS